MVVIWLIVFNELNYQETVNNILNVKNSFFSAQKFFLNAYYLADPESGRRGFGEGAQKIFSHRSIHLANQHQGGRGKCSSGSSRTGVLYILLLYYLLLYYIIFIFMKELLAFTNLHNSHD